MTILNGGGSSGVSPKNFNQGIEDVKSAVQDVQTSVNSLSSTMQSGMSDLQDSVEESLESVQTAVENAPVGGPIPYIIDTGKFKAESVEEGIKLTYTATIHAKADWDQFTARGSVPPYGVMIRYGTDGFPRTPNEGILAVDDTDIVDKTAKGPVAGNGLYGKTKTFTVVGLTNNILYYFSAFPYSYNKVFNINYGPLGADLSTNNSQRKTCTWTGTKATLTVTVTQDISAVTLGEITVTLTPTAGGNALTRSRIGPGDVVFSNLEAGEYTLSFSAANDWTTPSSQQITLYAGAPNVVSAQYKINVSLSSLSWSAIAAISEAGQASSKFSVRDEKDIIVGDETLTMQICGFNHDDLESSGKAGITFATKNLMANTMGMQTTETTNTGGYPASTLKTYIDNDLYNSLPSELRPFIKTVKKKVDDGEDTSVRIETMKLFLLSETELTGSTNNYAEGSQYPAFLSRTDRIKYLSNGTGSMYNYWTRTADSTREYYVAIRGDDYSGSVHNGNNMYPTRATNKLGICFGFCI